MRTALYTSAFPIQWPDLVRQAPAIAAEHPIESASDRYRFVSTKTVVEALGQQGIYPYAVQQSKARSSNGQLYAKHLLRFRYFGQSTIPVVGGAVPEIVVSNSHNTFSSYWLRFGIFRFVCTNGLIVAERQFGATVIRHTADVVDKVLGATDRIVRLFPRLVEKVEQWTKTTLTVSRQEEFAQRALGLRWTPEETPIKAYELLKARRPDDTGDSLWSVFNRVQENLEKGGLSFERGVTTKGAARQNKTRSISGVDANLELNEGIWALASEYAVR